MRYETDEVFFADFTDLAKGSCDEYRDLETLIDNIKANHDSGEAVRVVCALEGLREAHKSFALAAGEFIATEKNSLPDGTVMNRQLGAGRS